MPEDTNIPIAMMMVDGEEENAQTGNSARARHHNVSENAQNSAGRGVVVGWVDVSYVLSSIKTFRHYYY